MKIIEAAITSIPLPSIQRDDFQINLLPRCMECRRGLAMRFLSVRLSVRASNAWTVTKRQKNQSRFLNHANDHLL